MRVELCHSLVIMNSYDTEQAQQFFVVVLFSMTSWHMVIPMSGPCPWSFQMAFEAFGSLKSHRLLRIAHFLWLILKLELCHRRKRFRKGAPGICAWTYGHGGEVKTPQTSRKLNANRALNFWLPLLLSFSFSFSCGLLEKITCYVENIQSNPYIQVWHEGACNTFLLTTTCCNCAGNKLACLWPRGKQIIPWTSSVPYCIRMISWIQWTYISYHDILKSILYFCRWSY